MALSNSILDKIKKDTEEKKGGATRSAASSKASTASGSETSQSRTSSKLSSSIKNRIAMDLGMKKQGFTHNNESGRLNDSRYGNYYEEAASVDGEYINKFLSDWNSYASQAQTAFNNLGWKAATSGTLDKLFGDAKEDLRYRSALVGAYLESNKGNLDEETYSGLSSQLGSISQFLDEIGGGYSQAKDFYSQFETEEDYETSMRHYGYQQKYSGKSFEDLQAALAEMEDGEEKDWLSANQYDLVKTASDYDSRSSSGWERYMADQEAAQQAEDDKPWYVWLAETLGKTSDTTLPGASITQAQNAYREDTSYLEPASSWTEDQKGVYGYLYDTDKDAAGQYARSASEANNQAENAEKIAAIEKWATKNGWNGAAATLASIAMMPLSLADTLSALTEYSARGTVSTSATPLPGQVSTAITSAISNTLNEKYGTLNESVPVVGGKGLGDAYQLGTSIANSMLSAYTQGGLGTYVTFFGSASASGMYEAKNRGATDEQAITFGVLNGLAEAAGEAFSVEHLLSMGGVKELSSFFGNVLMQSGIEASEEGVTTLLNNFADQLVMGDKSNFNILVQQYMSEGMTEDEAKKQAWKSMANDLAFDMLGGAISGGVSSGLQTGVRTMFVNQAENAQAKQIYGADPGALVNEALEIDPDNAYAQKMQGKLDSGKNLSGGQLNRLVQQNEAALTAQDMESIQSAAAQRLTELGETGDVGTVAQALAKQAAGKKLSKAEQQAVSGSKYGQRVANELNTENIDSGDYSSAWAENIGTQRINVQEYSRLVEASQLPQETTETTGEQVAAGAHKMAQVGQAAVESGARNGEIATTSVRTGLAMTEESKQVAEDGVTRQVSTGKTVTPQKIVSIDGGKVMVQTDNGTIAADDIEFGTTDTDLLWRSAVGFNGITPSGANGIIRAYRSGDDVASYLHGAAQEFQNGYYNMESGGEYADKLTPAQREIIYELGQQASGENTAKAQAKAAEAKKAKETGSKTETAGKVHYDGDRSKLTKRQRTSLTALEKVSDALGVQIYVFESEVNAEGKRVGANGWYDPGDGSIHIDLYAGADGKGTMLFTAAHELVHFIKDKYPAKFKVLANFLMQEYGKRGVSVDLLVQEQILKAERTGREISYDTAYEEVIADSMETMLADGKVVEKLAKLKAQDKTLWQKMKDFITDLAAKIRNAYKGLEADSVEGRYVAGMKDAMERLQELFVEGLVGAGENNQAAAGAQKNTTREGDVKKFSDRDYSYEALTSKPDMAVTTVGGTVPSSRADVVFQAKQNAAKVGKFDPKTGSVSVHVDDIDADVLLGTDGLKHGLRRTKDAQNDANYIVTLNAGEIIKNSIKINEANPKKQNATGAYVLIGAARNKNGEMYIVRSIVNEFKNELTSMDVLYAVNAKKELAALNAPRSTAEPLSVTSSTISIAELLGYVNQYFPDILPEDVLKHYGYDSRPGGDFGENVLYSDRDPRTPVDNKSAVYDNNIIKTGEGEGKVSRLSMDSEGNVLSEEQKAFFARSQARDRDGNLLVLYHGTASAGFTAFEPSKGRLGGSWFTTSKRDADSYAGNYRGKLFDPNERDDVRTSVGGNFTLGSWMRFDSEADRAEFLELYPKAESIKTDAEYAELMQLADEAGDWDEYDRLEEEQQRNSSELRRIQKAYGRYEWEHSREATLQELFETPEQFSMSDVMRAWDAYDSNNSVGEDEATKEELIEALRVADRESIEQGDDTIADIRFKARLPVGQSGEIVNRANNRTYAVYANATKPYEIDAGGRTLHEADLYPAIEAGLKDAGYDSVIVRNAKVGAHEETGDVIIIKEAGQVKLTSNKAPTPGADIHYSERDPELERVNRVLTKENTELKHDIAYLKELLRLQKQVTGGTKFTKTSVEAAAGQLMKYANAKGHKAELAGLLSSVYEYIAKGEELTWDGVKEAAQPAVDWLQEHKVTKKQLDGYAQEILHQIRGSRIYLDEQQKKEVAYQYGSYNDFRKQAMGSVIITDKDSASLDSMWQEWASMYPNIFDAEISPNDMPGALMDAIDSLRNMTDMDAYGYDAELEAQDLLSQVYDSYWKVSTLYTVADAKQKEINKLKYEHAGRMATLRKYHRENAAKLKQEHREALQKVKQAERERAEKKQQEITERYQESRKKGAESRRKTEMRRKIRRTIMDLNKLLNRGDKKRNVKEDMKDLVATALDTADILFMDNYSNEDMVRDGVGTEMTEQEARYMKEAQEILAEIDGYMTSQERQEAEARLRGRLDYRMGKLQDVFVRERARLNKTKVSEVLGNLADAYASLENSEQTAVKGAFDENVYQYLLMVKDEVGGTIVRDMSLSQLEDLHKAYTMVLTTVRNANKMFAADLRQTREQLGSQTIAEVQKAGGEHGLWLPGEDKISTFSWNNQKPVYAFERIGSPTLAKLFENTRAGEDRWAQDMTEAREYYLERSRKYQYDSWDFGKQYKFTSTSGIDFSLNLEQIMSLYAYSKREQAHDHLMKGGFVFDGNTEVQVSRMGIKLTYLNKTAKAHNVSPEILGQITSKLSAEQRAFVDEMQDYLSTTMGGKGNEVSMRMYGVKLFNEKYYFPLRSAGQYMERAKEADLKKQQGQVSIVNSGFTKSTTPKSSNPVVLSGFMDVWADHVNEMSMYHSFVLPMEDFRRVYNYASPNMETGQSVSVNSVIQDAYGEAATGYIDQLYRDLNGGAVSDPRETPAKALMGKFKKAAVFASASVVIQQPSAIGRAFAIIDPKYFVGGKMDHKRHKALWAELKQYAPVAAIKEMGYFDTGMGKSAQDFIKGKEYNSLKEKAAALFTDEDYRDELLGKAPALADELTWCAIWEAAKRETKAKNRGMDVKSEEFLQLAGKRFTEVITKTQVYDSVLSRSANMRSKGALMSMWTAFMAEPTTTINMMEDALRKGKRGNKKYAARATGAVLSSIILNSVLVSLVFAMRDDDEDETFLEKYVQSFATEILDGINPLTYYPFLKDVWSAMQGFDIERSDMSLITSAIEAITKVVQLYNKDTDNMDEEELAAHEKSLADAWWGVVDYVTALAGVPVKNVRRDINGAVNAYRTISADLADRDTTWGSMIDKTLDDVMNMIPVIGWLPDETAADKLYKATVNGDTAYQKRLASSYRTESSLNSAIRKGLRANDSRIWEAAVAWNNDDLEEYARLAEEIVGEGNFSQDNVVRAIQAEAEAMLPKDSEGTASKLKGYFTAEKFAVAISQGNDTMAAIIKADIIETAQRNSKTAEEAEDSFISSAKSQLKELYAEGGLSDASAIDALTTYCDYDQEKATETVTKWRAQKETGVAYDDIKDAFLAGEITEADARNMYITYGGYDEDKAAETVSKWNAEKETGISYDGIKDAFMAGEISEEDVRNMYVTYGGYSAEDAAEKVAVLAFVKEYPECDGISYSAVENYQTHCEAYSVPAGTFYDAWTYNSSTKADVDVNGESISGSKKVKVLAYINGLDLTYEQKDSLYYAFGWAESRIYEAPWH